MPTMSNMQYTGQCAMHESQMQARCSKWYIHTYYAGLHKYVTYMMGNRYVVHVLVRTCAHIYVRYVCSFPGCSSWAGRVVIASIQRTRTSISQSEAFNFDIGCNFSAQLGVGHGDEGRVVISTAKLTPEQSAVKYALRNRTAPLLPGPQMMISAVR